MSSDEGNIILEDEGEGSKGDVAPEPVAHRPLNWVMLMFMTYIAVFGGGAYSIEAQVATGTLFSRICRFSRESNFEPASSSRRTVVFFPKAFLVTRCLSSLS